MQKLTAIVLSSRNIGEFDRMYFLYSRETGLLRAKGKGVRKPAAKLAGHLEPGTLSEIYIARSRGIGQITSAITLESYDNLKNHFEVLEKILSVFRFFTTKFSEGESDQGIFDLLVSLMENLNDHEDKKQILAEAFWWKLFECLGNRPETMKCADCGSKLKKDERKFFSAALGGVICKKCSVDEKNSIEMSVDQIKLLRVFLANPLAKILKIKIAPEELEGLGKIRAMFEKYNF